MPRPRSSTTTSNTQPDLKLDENQQDLEITTSSTTKKGGKSVDGSSTASPSGSKVAKKKSQRPSWSVRPLPSSLSYLLFPFLIFRQSGQIMRLTFPCSSLFPRVVHRVYKVSSTSLSVSQLRDRFVDSRFFATSNFRFPPPRLPVLS